MQQNSKSSYLGKTFKAEGSPSLQAVMDNVCTAREPDAKSREGAAKDLVDLIPPEVHRRLLEKKIDLSEPYVREQLLRNIEDFADGTSGFALNSARKLLGKDTFDAMLERVGRPIVPREGKVTEVGEQVEDSEQDDQLLSSDDVGGDMAFMTNGMHSDEEQSEFEIASAERSHNAIPPESMVFHHGTREGTVRTTAQAWDERKDKNGVMQLPQLLRLDTNIAKRKAESDEAYAARTAPGGAEAVLESRLADLRGKAEASLGQMRDRYIIASTTAKDVMDWQNMQPSKRTELFFKYAEKEKNPYVADLRKAHKATSDLAYMDRAMTDTVVNRPSISPSGHKLSIAEASAINTIRVKLERLRELVSSQDVERIDALIKEKRASKSTLNEKTSGYDNKGALKKSIGLAQIIRSARKVAEKNLNDTLALDPAIKSFMDRTQAGRGAVPEFDEVVGNFFAGHHMVTAEQGSNRDHLQMNLTEFRDMAAKGAKNEQSAWLAMQDLGWKPGSEAQTGKLHAARAGMNLIRFKSEHARGESRTVTIPAYLLVKWVRGMRKTHEEHLVEGGGDVRGKSNNLARQTEDYKRDLLEGITAVMQNGLTDGLPWIVNAKGVREDFRLAQVKGRPVVRLADGSQAPRTSGPNLPVFGATRHGPGRRGIFAPKAEMTYSEKGEQLGYVETALGSLPPSLDLNGITEKKATFNRAFSAQKRRDDALEHIESQSSLNEQRGIVEAQVLKDKELSAEPNDVQDADATKKAEDEATGSRTRDAQREDIKINTSIMQSATDAAPRAMSRGRALNSAGWIADRLWRDYLAGGAEHAGALGRMLALLRSARRPSYVEGEHFMTGGKHYIFPLVALLTPRRLAEVAARHPEDHYALAMMRSRVAGMLQGMREPQKGFPRITGAELGRLVDFLSGYTDRAVQAKLDAMEPSDPAQREEWLAGKSERLKWAGGGRVKFDGMTAFLTGLADATPLTKLHTTGSTVLAHATSTTLDGKPAKSTTNATPEQAAETLSAASRAEAAITNMVLQLAELEGEVKALRESDAARGEKLAKMRVLADKITAKLIERSLPVLGTGAEGRSQDIIKRLTLREQLIERKKNQVNAEPYESLGTKRSTDANDRRFLSAETVEMRTAETNARNNMAIRVAGKLADSARAGQGGGHAHHAGRTRRAQG